MFKVGDLVEVINEDSNRKGLIGEIIKYEMQNEWGQHMECIYPVMVKFKNTGIDKRYCEPYKKADLKLIKPKPFTPSDLKNGMVLTLRDGEEMILFKGRLIDGNGYKLNIDDYDDDFDDKDNDKEYDIMEVKDLQGNVLWKREIKYQYKVDVMTSDVGQIDFLCDSREELLENIGQILDEEKNVIEFRVEVIPCK